MKLRPVLSEPAALAKVGQGLLVPLPEKDGLTLHARSSTVAEILNGERIILVKWVRRLINWANRQAPMKLWDEKIVPLLRQKLEAQRTPVIEFVTSEHKIMAVTSLEFLHLHVPVDRHGVALWRPVERDVFPSDCAVCALVPVCQKLPTTTGTALLWRRLGLVEATGVPTLRGRLVSFFSGSDGLAIAAALQDPSYPITDLVYDLANLDAGFRFCRDENRWSGPLAMASQKAYGSLSVPGYLESGIPPKYGSGADQVVSSIHKNPLTKHSWVTELLGAGDIDRIIIEWRSLLRRVGHSPDLDWPRWMQLKDLARRILNETDSPTLTALPPLDYAQTKRIEHRLVLRR